MSAALYSDLAEILTRHGSAAVLGALRDACRSASDVTVGAAEAWTKAADAIQFAIADVRAAEGADINGPDMGMVCEHLADLAEEIEGSS